MEKDRIAIIKGVVKDGMSKRAASVKLCRSMKTINRMIKRYLEFGEEVLLQILTTYGIPIKIKTDRRTIFEYINKKSKDMSEDTFTQFAHACNRLGIELEARSTPEF